MTYRIAVGEVAHETNTFVAPAVEPFTGCIMLPTHVCVTRYAGLHSLMSR
jgi:hypothetical protein